MAQEPKQEDKDAGQDKKGKRGWPATLGRVLKNNAALIAALIALVGVLITQVVTTTNTQAGLEAQRESEEKRTLEAEWQTYLDDMGKMILDERNPLPEAKTNSAVASLARAKTLTILERLDARSDVQRKGLLLQFLHESALVGNDSDGPVVSLQNAILSGADLREVDLRDADLRGADLRDADVSDTDLSDTDLRGADLRGADLQTAADVGGAQR